MEPASVTNVSSAKKRYIAYDVKIGNRVKINAMVYICAAVTIEDGVMISASTTFTNDRFPRATFPDLKSLRPSEPDEHTLPTFVREGCDHRRRLHHRQRSRNRPLGDGRNGLGSDKKRSRFSSRARLARHVRSALSANADCCFINSRTARTVNFACECGFEYSIIGSLVAEEELTTENAEITEELRPNWLLS